MSHSRSRLSLPPRPPSTPSLTIIQHVSNPRSSGHLSILSPLSPSLQLGASLHSDSGMRRRETKPPSRCACLLSRRVLTSPLFLDPIFLHLDSPLARPSRYTTPRDPLSFTSAFPFPCAEPPEARKPLIGWRLLFSRVMSKSVRSRPPFHFTTYFYYTSLQ